MTMFKLSLIFFICIEMLAIGYLWGKLEKQKQVAKADCGECYSDLLSKEDEELIEHFRKGRGR